jgi:hypothetical protein
MIPYPALLAATMRASLRVYRWTPDGPVHVYVALANGERRELDPDTADTLLALLDAIERPAARAA